MPYVAHLVKELTDMSNPVSPKVVAAAIGAGAGSVVSTLIFWVIGTAVYHIPADSVHVAEAVAAVPSPITAAIGLVLIVLGAAIPGYQVTDPKRDVAERAERDSDGNPVIAE